MSVSYLHRLAQLIASVKPRTRTEFLRLYSVISSIKKAGRKVYLWEHNALMDSAGRGARKTQYADYQRSLAIFNDLVAVHNDGGGDDGPRAASNKGGHAAKITPDVYSYTTLLNIAARSKDPRVLRHAFKLFRQSKIAPNRVTHLVLLRYFTHKNDSEAIRHTMLLLQEQHIPLDIAALNAIIWAFARNGRLEIAWNIYRVLRHHLMPEEGTGADEVEGEEDINVVNAQLVHSRLSIPDNMAPDYITYHVMIQAFAYHGNVAKALQVFVDMLSTPIEEPTHPNEVPETFPPTMTAYRAFFHGFARHGRAPSAPNGESPRVVAQREPFVSETGWNWHNLELIFENFLELPDDVRLSDRTVWWIIVAFIKTSGANISELRNMWSRLEERYPGYWSERVRKFQAIITQRTMKKRDSRQALLDLIRNTS
ncbi:hypothetical protein NEOLEDRAFT_1061770 [Neolentinus lepideus HHB14362 ss-1]|uniref:Pentacotripeptide-repeat region of PRORP domain-containing protein n=1 Tax=Neolentinus lepideus HHB14362 ss-1 TaxID=1314782 RepID=A0A165TQS0_9AGAM|nr:hypothetical protein NEOLEDRAFT_1061770 [Neolentinus lepideus HHB14362 ss-1]